MKRPLDSPTVAYRPDFVVLWLSPIIRPEVASTGHDLVVTEGTAVVPSVIVIWLHHPAHLNRGHILVKVS